MSSLGVGVPSHNQKWLGHALGLTFLPAGGGVPVEIPLVNGILTAKADSHKIQIAETPVLQERRLVRVQGASSKLRHQHHLTRPFLPLSQTTRRRLWLGG